MSGDITPRVIRLYVWGAFRPVIAVRRGRAKTHVVVNTGLGPRVLAIPNRDADKAAEATYRSGPYPVRRAVKTMRQSGRERGITKSARRLLREAVA